MRYLTERLTLPAATSVPPQAVLLDRLARRYPTESEALKNGLQQPGLSEALSDCLEGGLSATDSVCGLSLGEVRELLVELSRGRLGKQERERRALLLTKLRNTDFGF